MRNVQKYNMAKSGGRAIDDSCMDVLAVAKHRKR